MNGEFKDGANYLARLNSFHRVDKERDELIKELVANCQDLRARLEKKCKEYDEEAQTRRLYQSQANEANKKLADFQRELDVNSFAFAIIDGNEALFRDDLISKGEEGGVMAANQLHIDIKKHLRTVYPDVSNLESWPVIVQVAFNLEGLSGRYSKADCTKSTSKLPEFTRGFSRAHTSFSVIDVGKDKEQADIKLCEIVRLMLSKPQCKHVIFGPCHDRHHNLQLKPLLSHPKIALLETISATSKFKELGYRMVRFPEVFRSAPLPGNAPGNPSMIFPRPRSGMETFIKEFKSSLDLAGRQATPTTRKYYLVNSAGERVDEPTPKHTMAAAQLVETRIKGEGRGPCYRYHLLGACDVASCTYYHKERLSPGEQLVLRSKARSFQCAYRSFCYNPDCLWGHHCRYGQKCQLHSCSYGDSHGIDITPAEKIYEDGSRERLPS
ncbi:hypothetical protein F4818DRAFT_418444 [Hypoxylon cercidicola]|nr:hypothetical protein F4818DRAFT_418444 [Hypoxylon cercidicola]